MKRKNGLLLITMLMLVLLVGTNINAGAQITTYILLRHAEKDTSAPGAAMMKADPPLSPEGEKRAQKLPEVLKAYNPDAVYSTNYARTKNTVALLAKMFNKEIQLYDPKNLPLFAEMLLKEKGKTIIVAGHSNTTPQLVNLLIGEKRYPDLPDSVYNRLWIVTLNNGKPEARIVTY